MDKVNRSQECKFPEMLRMLLKKNKMTHNMLALKMNVCLNTVDKWARGYSYPNMFTLMQLSNLFSISLDDLVYGTNGGRWSD